MNEQLQLWKKGQRKNDGGAQMAVPTKRLSDQDIAAAAAYFQQARSAPSAALLSPTAPSPAPPPPTTAPARPAK